MKWKLFFLTLGLFVTAMMPAFALDPDPGIPDTIIFVVAQGPDANAGQMHVQIDAYVYSDETLVGASGGYYWDNPFMQMDSAVKAPLFDNGFDLIASVYEDDDINTTNANQRFVLGGASLFSNIPGDAGGRRLWASYYFTLSNWTVNDSIVIDSLTFSAGTSWLMVADGQITFEPIWGGKLVIYDPNRPSGANLVVTPQVLNFTAVEGGANPDSQTFAISSDGESLDFALFKTAGWLALSPTAGMTDAEVTVSVDISGLGAGSYLDTIVINSEGAQNAPQYVVVNLMVTAAPKYLAVTPDTLYFNAIEDSTNPDDQVFTVSEVGGAGIPFAASESASWFDINKNSGTTPDDIAVSVDINGLTAGGYFDSVTVTSDSAANSPVFAYISLNLQPAEVIDTLVVTPDTLYFTKTAGGPDPDPQSFFFDELHGNAIPYSLALDSTWFSLSKYGGTTPDSVVVYVEAGSMLEGSYLDSIQVSSDNADNTPFFIYVMLEVTAAANQLVITPDTLYFNATEGGTDPDDQTFTVSELSGGSITFTAAEFSAWFSIDKTVGTTPEDITVSVDISTLTTGTYTDAVEISSPEAINSPQYAVIILTVSEGCGGDEYFVYANFDETNTDGVYIPGQGCGGYQLDDTTGFLYVARGGQYCDVYMVTIPSGTDPNQHPDNPANPGEIVPRTLTLVGSRDILADMGTFHICQSYSEFYVDDNYVYYGPSCGGIHQWAKNPDGTLGDYLGKVVDVSFSGESMAYDAENNVWYSGYYRRDIHSFRPGIDTEWQYEFSYPSYAGSHHDGLEFYNGYLWISDMTSNYIGQWHYADTGNGMEWIEVQRFSYENPVDDDVEGLGIGPFGHFWATGWSRLYELGGGWLNFSVHGIPDQTVCAGTPFEPFDLDDYGAGVPPLTWTWSTPVNLNISVDENNVVTVTYPDGWIGSEDIAFTLTDACDRTGTTVATFTVESCGGDTVIIPTNEWINVYCDYPELNGTPLSPGDVIMAYDPDGVPCGIDTVREDGSFGFMPIYRDDIYSTIDEGAEPGDVISFTINGEEVFPETPIIWTSNGDSYELCSFTTERCVEISLHKGWNLISWNVAYSAEISEIMAQLGKCTCVEVILGFDQGALTYDPDLPEFSTLLDVDYYHGYWFKMNCDATLEICGMPVDPSECITIYNGWNLVSYWPDTSYATEDGFASILDNVIVALGYDNGGLTWIPDNDSYNTLTDLYPLFGYWVKSSADAYLAYPGFCYGDFPSVGKERPDFHVTEQKVTPSRSWMSLYGAGITFDGNELTAGTTIDVYTKDGTLCGSAQYDDGMLKFTPVYGYDPFGDITAHYPKDGEPVTLYVDGIRAYPDIKWAGHSSRIEVNALFSTAAGAGLVPDHYALNQNYPNPFNPTTDISFSLPVAGKVTLDIYNVLGQKVTTLVDGYFDAGEHTVVWDGTDANHNPVSSGIYLYRLQAGDFSDTKKMMLVK